MQVNVGLCNLESGKDSDMDKANDQESEEIVSFRRK